MARIYLGGPISGLSYQEARYGWRADFDKLLASGLHSLSPMRQEGKLAEIKEISSVGYDSSPLHTNKGIVAKDCLDIERSDLVVMNFQGAKKVSVGSVWEMGYAKCAGKRIVSIMDKDRADDPHLHCFIIDSSDFIVHSVDEAAAIVNALLSTGV